jgi:hypothetical protein
MKFALEIDCDKLPKDPAQQREAVRAIMEYAVAGADRAVRSLFWGDALVGKARWENE